MFFTILLRVESGKNIEPTEPVELAEPPLHLMILIHINTINLIIIGEFIYIILYFYKKFEVIKTLRKGRKSEKSLTCGVSCQIDRYEAKENDEPPRQNQTSANHCSR